jgi:prepilin-type processing-associated H-X9-DG protein
MPINFTCPHCGHNTGVADQYAGQTGPCTGCGKAVTIPTPPGVAPAEVAYSPAAPSKRSSPALIVVVIVGAALMAFCIVGILIALLLPAVQAAREAARRTQCANNLKQINLAMLNYHDVYGTFPPAYLADENGQPMHSWRVLLLPFMEEKALYDQYDFDEPWDSPNNSRLAAQIPTVYQCPSASLGVDETHYVVVDGPGYIFDGDTACAIADVSDGLSNTILVVEAPGSPVGWLEPAPWQWTGTLDDLGVAHPGGINIGLADGSVHFLNVNTDPTNFEAGLTKDGGEEFSLGR